MGEYVYLDHNVVADVYQNRRPGLRDAIDTRKKAGDIFPYSPAHMEEIAVVRRSQSDQEIAGKMIADQLDLVAELSDTWEILPAMHNDGPSRVVQEHPSECMDRVMKDYDLTLFAEENERFQLSWQSEKAFNQVMEEFETPVRTGPGIELFPQKRERHGIGTEITKIIPEEIFNHTGVQEALREKLWHYCWSLDTLPKGEALIQSHVDRQNVVNILLKVLQQASYFADPFEKHRSHMHDVTHAIYAAVTNVFVTGDKRYAMRVRAVYHYLGLTTRVMLSEDFILHQRGGGSDGQWKNGQS